MIRLRTLGPVEVTMNGAAPPGELVWRKNLAMLVYLARSPRRTRTREHLVGLLWGDRPETAARHSLREAVRVLRRVCGESFVETDGELIRLPEALVELDVDRFQALAQAGDWAGAASLAEGEFLEGFTVPGAAAFEEWLDTERRELRRRSVEVLAKHAEGLLRAGNLAGSTEAARRALGLEPMAEVAVRALMRALAVGGDRAAALSAYERLAEQAAELGTRPSPETERLVEQVRLERAWRAAVSEDDARQRGAESRRAPLVGREQELAALLDVWHGCTAARRAAVALIEGDTGVGRTRIADEVATRARLGGAVTAGVRAVPADTGEAWSVVLGLARGGLLEARGVAAAPAAALAAFASRIAEWGDRFPAARTAPGEILAPGPALVEVARAAADEQPVLVVADDAQWTDPASLGALDALARDLAGSPVLVLLTRARHPPHPELDRIRAAIGRDTAGVVVDLTPLTPLALRDLAHWALPRYTPVELDRITRRITVDSAGLPLLAVELLHAVALGLDLHEKPQAWPEQHQTLEQTLPGDLPEAVISAIRVGYRRLSKDAQLVLAAASVLGDKVDVATLARATGLEAERVVAALDEAEWQRWLAADGRGYSYVARIVRDVIGYDMVTAGQRRRFQEATLSLEP